MQFMDKFPLFQRNYEDSFHFSKNKEKPCTAALVKVDTEG